MGSLDHGRASHGKFVGVNGASYLVWREKRQTVVHQHAVTPLNELALIRSSTLDEPRHPYTPTLWDTSVVSTRQG